MTMPLSLLAQDFGTGKLPRFGTASEVGHYVREFGLYPRDGQMQAVEGAELGRLLQFQTLQQIEDRINELSAQMRQAKPLREEALGKAMELAESSNDAYELHYMANMFMQQKEVLRAIAKNPILSEKTQLLLVSLPEVRQDRQVQLNLAHNPAMCSTALEKMVSYTEDAFVLQGIAHNASRQSLATLDDTAFAGICKQLASVLSDDTLCKAAIPGVKDPELLRSLADNNNAFFAADKLALIAQNIYTPTDVLERMASNPLARPQHVLGIDYSVKARHTLALQRQQQLVAEPESYDPAPH